MSSIDMIFCIYVPDLTICIYACSDELVSKIETAATARKSLLLDVALIHPYPSIRLICNEQICIYA
jgi:hypothetical protein